MIGRVDTTTTPKVSDFIAEKYANADVVVHPVDGGYSRNRRGVDVSPWYDDMSQELLAATVGYYMIRSHKPPLAPGGVLREMQAGTAAVANCLYGQLQEVHFPR